jgi:hypothetical protein
MRLRIWALAAIFVVVFGAAGHGQRGPVPDQRSLPPLLYTCPHHADHLQDAPGSCPMQMEPGEICKMELVPVRIESDFWYTCPVHTNVRGVLRPKPGMCPIDRRALMPVTVTVHWTCKQDPYSKLLEPGKCLDGSSREVVREVRAHGDHNPRHGGAFFMAFDLWHHLEGTYPRAGLVRVYFYDNFTQPIDATAFIGRLVLREEFDSATNRHKELEVIALKPGPEKNTLDGALQNDKLPLLVTLKVKFDPNGREQRSDFVFNEYSKELPAGAPK